jgi:hypothetical protein
VVVMNTRNLNHVVLIDGVQVRRTGMRCCCQQCCKDSLWSRL